MTSTTRHVVVTGAASGIGRQCCAQLAAEGWSVHPMDIVHDDAVDGRAIIRCDVRDETSVASAFAEVARRTPRLDALVCSAGVLRMAPLVEMAAADFDAVFAVNTRGPWLCAKAALPLLEASARRDAPARMVMLASIAAVRPKVGGGAYAASKAALARIVAVMAVELAARHVLVNALAPATVDTPMIAQARQGAATRYRPSGESPLGRIATPADIANAVSLLLDPRANYVTGVLIPVDGGTSAAYVPPAT
jgi:NAD(P)-dependent dehydrogenase (short-subunit alcohol dehydrogenase family)